MGSLDDLEALWCLSQTLANARRGLVMATYNGVQKDLAKTCASLSKRLGWSRGLSLAVAVAAVETSRRRPAGWPRSGEV